MKTYLSSIAALLLLLAPAADAGTLAGPFLNPANGHAYFLLSQDTWTASETMARALGGDLVTINDAAENQWVFNAFSAYGGIRRLLWLGLNDAASTGHFTWISGEPVTYLNWSPVEPNNVGAEHYVLMYPSGLPPDAFKRYPGTWNNLRNYTSDVGLTLHGVAELSPFRWIGGTNNWSNTNSWTPAPPPTNATILVPAGSIVSVDVTDAQIGSVVLDPGGTLAVPSGSVLTLNGPAVNNGTVTLSGDVISYASGNAFVQNGTLSIKSGVAMRGLDSGGHDFAFVQTGGATTVAGTLDFLNGIIQVQGGNLNVNQDAALKGMDSGGGDLAYIQTGGAVTIDGTFTTSNAGLQGGTLNGSGTIAGNLVADAGMLSPGSSPGTLTITNDFTQNAGNTLRIEVAGRGAGQFDQLRIGGAATLGGRLSVRLLNGFAPAPGDQFPILTAASVSGALSGWDVPTGFSVNYSNTAVFLVVTGTVPAQIIGPTVSGGNLVFSFGTVSNRSYTVQFNDDLTTTNWLFYTDLTGNGGLMGFATSVTNAPQRYFRVRQP